jgi:hypothetical protein
MIAATIDTDSATPISKTIRRPSPRISPNRVNKSTAFVVIFTVFSEALAALPKIEDIQNAIEINEALSSHSDSIGNPPISKSFIFT